MVPPKNPGKNRHMSRNPWNQLNSNDAWCVNRNSSNSVPQLTPWGYSSNSYPRSRKFDSEEFLYHFTSHISPFKIPQIIRMYFLLWIIQIYLHLHHLICCYSKFSGGLVPHWPQDNSWVLSALYQRSPNFFFQILPQPVGFICMMKYKYSQANPAVGESTN